MIIGMNWSPSLDGQLLFPLINAMGRIDAEPDDPVVIVAHLAYPSPSFMDRSKSRAEIPPAIALAIQSATCKAGERWRKLKAKREREGGRAIRAEIERQRRQQRDMSLKEAVVQVLPDAYRKASGNGTLPVLARQLFYAVRPLVVQLTDRPLNDRYFTQNLLRELPFEQPELFSGMDILFDPRGHATSPYSGVTVPLGTSGVRSFIHGQRESSVIRAEIPSIDVYAGIHVGNVADQHSCAMYVEKEGFKELFDRTGVLKRYGVFLLSGKGQPTDAVRDLAAFFAKRNLPILVLHDFDYSGLCILKSFIGDSETYKWKVEPNVIDIGLRLADVEAMGLESEPCVAKNVSEPVLGAVGATDAERAFLFKRRGSQSKETYRGHRVEINEMTTPQLITFLEQKFDSLGLEKPIPSDQMLEDAYREFVRAKLMERELRDYMKGFQPKEADEIVVPEDLRQRLVDRIKGNDEPWNEGIEAIADSGTDV